jgi:hypothetical protein
MVTYEDRLKNIIKKSDIEKQLNLAKKQVMRLRNKSKKEKTLALKVERLAEVRQSEQALRQLRINVFDIEDSLLTESGEIK